MSRSALMQDFWRVMLLNLILTLKQEQIKLVLYWAKRLVEEPTDNVSNPNLRICCPSFQKLKRRCRQAKGSAFSGPFDTADCEMSSDALGFQSSGNPVRCVGGCIWPRPSSSASDRYLQKLAFLP